jgi:glycyl-tRNA synthetase beta chain
MTERRDLLIEIGSEELPPKALQRLSAAFVAGVQNGLQAAGLGFGSVEPYATPRRLAMLVRQLDAAQPEREVVKRGPARKAAFKPDGQPTPAALGFASSCGVGIEQLETLTTDKGEWLAWRTREGGQPVQALIPDIVAASLARLPIPRRMRWGSGSAEFVRPVHWTALLYGDELIEAEILGVRSNAYTRGHRFHHPAPIHLDQAADYVNALENRGFVLPSFERRRERIDKLIRAAATAEQGTVEVDADLLDEVTALNEWPVALVGGFDTRFLALPEEVLIAVMQGHQRYFPIANPDGGLMPRFVAIANLESRDPDAVRRGNERVIRPRLSDAEFFWNQDCAVPLSSQLDPLKNVVFQKQLGSLYDKTERLTRLAAAIAPACGADGAHTQRAAQLSRCDLMTQMVGEFPELQGIMGRYYAAANGEPPEVAIALDEMYQPRHAGDILPASATGRALALAERLDTLVGIFGIGEIPGGDKDPYGLRRAALGALRIIIECELDLDLQALLAIAGSGYDGRYDEALPKVSDFMMERLRAYYLDAAVGADTFEAVLSTRPTRPLDFDRRLRAVSSFRKLPAAASLSAANKRIANILRKADQRIATEPDPALYAEPAEKALADAIAAVETQTAPLLAAQDYTAALTAMATLRDTVDAFFDAVMVMCDDAAMRDNRLALLNRLRELFLRVADISRLQD